MPDKVKSKKKVNPQVHTVDIGVRYLRKIKIYPLSVADQLELTDMITEAISAFFAIDLEKMKDGPPAEFIMFMFNLIKSNLGEIVTKITGEEDSDAVLGDMTNDQLSEIVGIVYKENFEGPLAKLVDLFQGREGETEMAQSILERLQSQSAGSTGDTGSKTSSEKATGKEALH